ncbi:hypothetical protein [Pseudolactococcus yaeyamensis]
MLKPILCAYTQSTFSEEKLVDGTKLEDNANKFTFVWKKSIERFRTTLIEKSEPFIKSF